MRTAFSEDPNSVDRGALALAHPHDFQVQLLAAALAEGSGDRVEAQRWAERALMLAPNTRTTLDIALRMRLAAGDEAGATELVGRLDPDGTGNRHVVELVLDASWAKAVHERFFADHPERANLAAMILRERRQIAEAERLLVWALARSPRALVLYEQLGQLRSGDADFLERLASTCLFEASQSETEDEQNAWERLGYFLQARVAFLKRDDRQAFYLFRVAADLDPAHAQAPLLEALRSADRLGDATWTGEIIARLEAMVARAPLEGAWPRGEFHFFKSRAFERSGDLGAAVREMHSALRHLGHVGNYHERLAGLFERTGDSEAALRARERARSIAKGTATP